MGEGEETTSPSLSVRAMTNLKQQILEFRSSVSDILKVCFRPKQYQQEKADREHNQHLKAHWHPEPIEVEELIYERWKNPSSFPSESENDNFIVFIDHVQDVEWLTGDKSDPDDDSAKAISHAEAIGSRRCKQLPRDQVFELRRILGQAITCSIQRHVEESYKLSRDAESFLRARSIEQSRRWTLNSAHLFVVVISFVVLWATTTKAPEALDYLGSSLSQFSLLSATLGGVLGAYLSLIQKSSAGVCDSAAGIQLHRIEAFTKIFSGALLGFVALMLSQSDFAPEVLNTLDDVDGYSLFILGFAAGFIERLIPRMISNYSETLNS